MNRTVLSLLIAIAPCSLLAAEWRFELSFPEAVRATPFTGRVHVLFSRTRPEPRTGPGWFDPESFVAKDVTNWSPGTPLVIAAGDESLHAYPKPLGEMDLAGSTAQAVARFSATSRNVGTGPGNAYSKPVRLRPPFGETTAMFTLDAIVAERAFRETDDVKLIRVRSKRLSEFHGRDVTVNAAVHLPEGYAEHPERRYPTIFYVPGFGGTLRERPYLRASGADSQPFLEVMLDPSCPLGHHVFADSANNGPWGTALVEEFLPEFDRRFRTIPTSTARFLTGHSSGGWATLWMQVSHPDTFGGTWSTAPDPVDFRDFQRIDMYDPASNMYVDAAGQRRPLARVNGEVKLWYEGFDRMETVLGPGGQLHSFEAAFSPRGEDGRPQRAWSRETGRVNVEVTRAWEAYDVRLVLERDWATLGPKLAGKLHVVMGEGDNFYLEGATRALQASLAKLGSDAVVELVPGRDHFTLLDAPLRERIRREMTESFRAAERRRPEQRRPE